MYKDLLLFSCTIVISNYLIFTTQNPASFELISNHPLNKRDQKLLIGALNNFAENLNQYERTIENIILQDGTNKINSKLIPKNKSGKKPSLLEKTIKKKASSPATQLIEKAASTTNYNVIKNGSKNLNQRDQEHPIDTNNNYIQTFDLPYVSEINMNQDSETTTKKNDYQNLNAEQFNTFSESNQENSAEDTNVNDYFDENPSSVTEQVQNEQPDTDFSEATTIHSTTTYIQPQTTVTTHSPTTLVPVAVIPVYTTPLNTYNYNQQYYKLSGCYHIDSPNYEDLTLYHRQTSFSDLINKCKATFMPNDFIVVQKNCYEISSWQQKYSVTPSNDCLNEFEQKCNLNLQENCYGINSQSFAYYSVNGASLVSKSKIIKTYAAKQ